LYPDVDDRLVWTVVNWSYSGVVASKNGQIELQDRQQGAREMKPLIACAAFFTVLFLFFFAFGAAEN
jgi:hypothetical protein